MIAIVTVYDSLNLPLQIDRGQYGKPTGDASTADANDPSSVMASLTKYIYNYQGTDLGRIRTRAMLCHIYHYALHNRWYQARDLMMMSHLQEAIHLADVPTQVTAHPHPLWWVPFIKCSSPFQMHALVPIPDACSSPFQMHARPHSRCMLVHCPKQTPHFCTNSFH